MEHMDNADFQAALDNILKKSLKNIVFLELNKDISLSSRLKVKGNIPLPIESSDLLEGIKSGQYSDAIDFKKIAEAMIYLLGCDSKFKYNNSYVDILKSFDSRIDSYILSRAMNYSESEDYLTSLIYLRALDKISDKHKDVIDYNIANTLRNLALISKEKNNKDDYELYYKLSFNAFVKLSRDFPELAYGRYYLGYYYFDEGSYESAINEWENAFRLFSEEDLKCKVDKMIESAKDCMDFERGKKEIIDGDVMKGLKILIPLSEKLPDWRELKYYMALGYRKSGNYEKAQIKFYELLKEGEEFPELYNELGLCCFTLGEAQKSIDFFKKALSLMEDHPVYLCNLAMALYSVGDIEGAKRNINKAYDLNPRDEFTYQLKSWIEKA